MSKGRHGDPYRVLFLCTGNSARSILAEAILNRVGAPRFEAYSAGSRPKGVVHPQAIALLRRLGFETEALYSKSWRAFAATNAPELHLVISVCAAAEKDICPVWPGAPERAHWDVPDPSESEPAAIAQAMLDAYHALHERICCLCAQRSAPPLS